MRDPKGIISEKAFGVLYTPDVYWLVLPKSSDKRDQIRYKSNNIVRLLAISDNAPLQHDVTEHSDPEKESVKLEFKRGSLVVFDGQNHFLFYYPDDIVNQ